MFGEEKPSGVVRWPVLRVDAGHDVEVSLLGGRWLRLATHFHKRTQICLGDETCPVCQLLPSRCYYYLPACFTSTRRPVLLELSAMASADLEQNARLTEQGLRAGLTVKLRRRSKRAPLQTEVIMQDRVRGVCSEAEWCSAVMAIYGFGAMRPGEALEDYRRRLMPSAIARCERLAAELRGTTQRSGGGV